MHETDYASIRIAKAFREHFGDQVETLKVEMMYTREVADFIRKIDEAHKATARSKLVFNAQ